MLYHSLGVKKRAVKSNAVGHDTTELLRPIIVYRNDCALKLIEQGDRIMLGVALGFSISAFCFFRYPQLSNRYYLKTSVQKGN